MPICGEQYRWITIWVWNWAKIESCNSSVIPVLLYGCETWNTTLVEESNDIRWNNACWPSAYSIICAMKTCDLVLTWRTPLKWYTPESATRLISWQQWTAIDWQSRLLNDRRNVRRKSERLSLRRKDPFVRKPTRDRVIRQALSRGGWKNAKLRGRNESVELYLLIESNIVTRIWKSPLKSAQYFQTILSFFATVTFLLAIFLKTILDKYVAGRNEGEGNSTLLTHFRCKLLH